MAVIYEVTLHVREALAADYLAWLREHVGQMLALPGFVGAELAQIDEVAAGERGWCVRYTLRDRASLDAYFRDHAPRMRGDGIARFGDAFRASRRILVPVER